MPVEDDGGGGNGGESPRNWYSEERARDQGPIYTPYGNICVAGPRSLFVIRAERAVTRYCQRVFWWFLHRFVHLKKYI